MKFTKKEKRITVEAETKTLKGFVNKSRSSVSITFNERDLQTLLNFLSDTRTVSLAMYPKISFDGSLIESEFTDESNGD